jgi:anti-sigma-K factor RskA
MAFEPEDSTSDRAACDFVRDNADAFALGALTPEESQRIVRHIDDHPECQSIVSAANAVASALAYSMPLIGRPDLAVKLRLFDRIAAESATPTANASRIETSDKVIAALNSPAVASPPQVEVPPRRPWLQHVSTALIAPLAIALTIMSLWAYNLNDELDEMRDNTEANEGVASNTIEMWTMETSDSSSNARGSLGALPDQTSAVLLAWNLDPQEDLEVWCEEENGKKWMVTPLEVGDDGAAMQTIVLPKGLDEYKSIYVSGGEDSGSETPELMLTLPEKTKPDPHDDLATPTW